MVPPEWQDNVKSKTIFFYIVRELLLAFFVCFLFFFFIFFINQILLMAGQILSKRVPFYQVVLLLVYSMPSIIAMASPFACLTGTLITIGRFSSDNEILVILSSGLSRLSIFVTALAVGLLISLFSFFANDILLPAGTAQFIRLYRRILFSAPALEMESNSIKRFRDTVIITGPVAGNTIRDIVILDRTVSGERRTIIAETAELEDLGEGTISIKLSDAFVQSRQENLITNYDYASAQTLSYLISEEDISEALTTVGPREMSSYDLRQEIINKETVLADALDLEYLTAGRNALSLETALRRGETGSIHMLASSWEHTIFSIQELINDRSLSIYRLEYYKKFSIPFGALSFVLVAVSIGLMANKGGQTVGFIVGICISALYWGLLLIGQELGTRLGYSPFWAMWFPNALAIIAGFIVLGYRYLRR